MSATLKDQNRIGLYTAMAANLALYFAMSRWGVLFAGDWAALAGGWLSLLPAGLGLIVVGVLNAQVDAITKAQLVFLRRRDPLPASEAFTRWGPADPRVDMAALATKFGPLPTDPKGQNALWYRLYKSVEDAPAVEHAHREYLFTRDFHFLSALMLIGFGILAVATFVGVGKTLLYLAILLAQFLMTGQAARNHGQRLVCTVLARKAAEEDRAKNET
ncbi:MAG TPA: hypothetical protein VG841_02435 [Caulobacterales bacterium]|nr:hypothetical protein [Caulobacterales bacterium]